MSQPNSDLINFARFLKQEVVDTMDVTNEGGFRESSFTEVIIEYLSDFNETGNNQVCTVVHRNKSGKRIRQLNGYGLWDNYETLDIFVTEYKGEGKVYTLERVKVLSIINLASQYLNYLMLGNFLAIEDSSEEKEFQENFNNFRDSILRIRIILLTDGLVKKEIDTNLFKTDNITIITDIWDLERIYQLWSSKKKREPISIDIPSQFNQSVNCLQVEQTEDNYTTYLGIVPATLLADLYDVYGSRLLEQNVRVYLQNLGKVNKDIRKTIIETPGMFMAYNNGISATATQVTTEKDNKTGFNYIKSIKDLQIVNGGQTTSSIYYARKKDRADISKINVQMKITLVHDDQQMEELVSRISKYANSQNKVSETDLTSNQTFHIELEELSRTSWVSPKTGHQQTRWYYERVKGQYREEINKQHTQARKKAFTDRNPSHQIIRKDEFAKFRNAWFLLPHIVVRGSQKNYLHFLDTDGKNTPTRSYFQETVSAAILFREGEKLYGKKPYSMGDLRYIVVPYSLAWLNYHTHGRINTEIVWKTQIVPNELIALIKSVLLKVNEFLQQEKPDSYALVSEWAKREDCWSQLKKHHPKEWNIETNSIDHLFIESNAKKKSNQDLVSPLQSLSIKEWETIELFGKETGKLTPSQIGTVRNIISKLRKQKILTQQLIELGIGAVLAFKEHQNDR